MISLGYDVIIGNLEKCGVMEDGIYTVCQSVDFLSELCCGNYIGGEEYGEGKGVATESEGLC